MSEGEGRVVRVLVIEDGTEYVDSLTRFLADGFAFVRAGSGPVALAALSAAGDGFGAAVLDMRFDRAPESELLGDAGQVAEQRFNGDPVAARRHLEDHQGTYILAAIRDAGHALPVVLSYDFGGEPKRWQRLAARHGPIAYAADDAGPAEIGALIRGLLGA